MKVPFTWKVTGWFMIGWSAGVPGRRGAAAAVFRRGSGRLPRRVRRPASVWRRTASTSARTSATAARSSATASNARSTAGAGDPTAPIATSRTSRTGPTRSAAAGVSGPGAVRLRVHLASARRQGSAVGNAGHLRQVPAVRNRPGCLLPAVSRSSPAVPSATRCTRRSSPRTGPTVHISEYVHGATVTPGLPGLGTSSTRSGASSPAGPTPAATTRTIWRLRIHSHLFGLGWRDQRVRGLVEPSADLRLHAGRRRGVGHVLFDLVAAAARRHLRRPTGDRARRSRKAVPVRRSGTTRHLALPEVRRASRAVQDRRETVYGHA